MTGVMLLIFTPGGTNLPLAEVWRKMYLGWVLAWTIWDLVVFLQSVRHYQRHIPQDEPEPPRRREISPGLGELPLPSEERHVEETVGGGAVASGVSSSAVRNGSSNFPGGFRGENSGGRLSLKGPWGEEEWEWGVGWDAGRVWGVWVVDGRRGRVFGGRVVTCLPACDPVASFFALPLGGFVGGWAPLDKGFFSLKFITAFSFIEFSLLENGWSWH